MLRRSVSTLLICVVSCFAAKTPEPPKLRLGDAVTPTRYRIDLTIIPGKDGFKGSAAIEVNLKQPQDLVWLNATSLTIESAKFEQDGKSEPASVIAGGEQFVGLSLGRERSGAGTLRLSYTGKISRNSSAGLFQLKDNERWYVYSQFEATDARRAFPSFDEPSFKTPWQLTLHVPKSDMALSNTPPIEETKEAGDLKTVRFGETKPLPSYLVALAVGPFDAVSAGKLGKTPLRVIVPHGRGSEAKFAVEAIPQLLKLLEQYFGTPFPYEKLDSVVMPISNFAMENVGLITYGQSLLLSKPENDSYGRQRVCATVVAHEMAHQWFGDSVTTAWWNDIWLNEAFATWMENKIVDEWKPEWNMAVGEVESRLGAMKLDSLVSSRRIRQPIVSNDDIANAFDGITYEKGAAVISMFEHWIGSDTFRQGVRQYIRQHANGNATTADFEAAISSAAGKDIAPAFNSFLEQAGIPLVTVSLECGSAQPALRVSQKRALPLGSPGSAPQTWQVPVCVKYESGGEVYSQCEVLADPRSTMALKQAKACPAWVLANDGEVGYYRVDYQGKLLEQLLGKNAEKLSTAEKVGVLGDVRSLVDSAQISPKAALALGPEFANDSHRQVVESVLGIAELTTSSAVPDDLEKKGSAYIRSNFGKRALALSWHPEPGEPDNDRLLRMTLVPDVASDGQQKELIAEAQKMAKAWLENRTAISPDLFGSVMRIAAEFGDRDLFDRLQAAAKKEQDHAMRESLIRALGSFRDPELAKSGLALLLSDEFDPRETFYRLLFGPLRYRETRALPFEFVKANMDKLLQKLPREVGGDFAATLPNVGMAFCDARHRAEVKDLFEARVKELTGGPRNLAKALEVIDVCIAKKKALGPELSDFLRAN